MKKFFTLLACFLLVFTGVAYAGVAYVDQGDNTGYVFSESEPNVQYHINNVKDFTTDLAYAALHRNDYSELTLVGDSVHRVGVHMHKYEVLAGTGEVHAYFYRLLDDDFGDSLYLQLTEKAVGRITDTLKPSDTNSKSNKKLLSTQTISTLAKTVGNAEAGDVYGSLAGVSRLTAGDTVKNAMLLYFPILSVRDMLESGVDLDNVTDLFMNVLYIID